MINGLGRSLLVVCIVCVVCLPALAQKTWTYLGEGQNFTAIRLIITQRGNGFEVSGTLVVHDAKTQDAIACPVKGSYFPTTARIKATAECRASAGSAEVNVDGVHEKGSDAFTIDISHNNTTFLTFHALRVNPTQTVAQHPPVPVTPAPATPSAVTPLKGTDLTLQLSLAGGSGKIDVKTGAAAITGDWSLAAPGASPADSRTHARYGGSVHVVAETSAPVPPGWMVAVCRTRLNATDPQPPAGALSIYCQGMVVVCHIDGSSAAASARSMCQADSVLPEQRQGIPGVVFIARYGNQTGVATGIDTVVGLQP